jgi:serine/threonine-protein kinase
MTEEKDTIEPGRVVASRYRIERRLGQGGMGAVYEVEHQVTGQHLALKVLDPKLAKDTVMLERFRRESRAPARIDSDHVVKVTDADVAPELGGAPFLVMELLRGQSFDQLLDARGTLPPQEALVYLGQIARALDRAHAIGIIHRDIKPENLFLTEREDGTPLVKLLDFGIAKLTEGGGSIESRTATGEVFGTPLYMSPEQTLGRTDQIAPQTDIWALGIIAHKLLIGNEPWTAQTLPHLIAQIAYEPLPVPSEHGGHLGPTFDAWFARACAREPGDRFASAGEAVRELASAVGVSDLGVSSQHNISLRPASSSRRDAALAATAQADSEAAIGSDTLTAQVAPGKPRSRFVLAASVGGVAIAVAAAVLVARGSGAGSGAAAGPTASATQEPPEATESAPVIAPLASDAAPEVSAAASASVEPATTTEKKPVVRHWTPPPKPKASAAPKPKASAAPKPTSTSDPLSGRH